MTEDIFIPGIFLIDLLFEDVKRQFFLSIVFAIKCNYGWLTELDILL